MSKVYAHILILSFLLLAGKPVFAQAVDFFAEIDMDEYPNLCPGKIFGDSTTESGPKGIWSMGTYGPATIYENTKIWFVNSMSRFLTQQERDSLGAGPNTFWIQKLLIQQNVEAPDYVDRESTRPVNDIGILLDWDLYQSGTISYVQPPYETDKAYGFFVHVMGMGDDPEELENTDNNTDNNWAVKRIVWGCNAVSIGDLLDNDHNRVLVFPNPAQSQITIQYTLSRPGDVQLNIRDITGKSIENKTERNQAAGEQLVPVNIAHLSNGLYFLEVTDGKQRASAKFIVKH